MRPAALACCSALALALASFASAQEPVQPAPPDAAQQPAQAAQQPDAPQQTAPPEAQSGQAQKPAATPDQPPAISTPPAPEPPAAAPPTTPKAHRADKSSKEKAPSDSGAISEDELKQMLLGKKLYLRGGYLDNNLKFDELGRLTDRTTQGSYTLSAIEITKIRLTKHKLELTGIRYGLHFSAQLAYEDPATALDRVRITPKKKVVAVSIDREIVVKPKKQKEPKAGKEKGKKDKKADKGIPAAPAAEPAAEPAELSEADQLKASIAAAPEAERPTDAKSVTTTTSPAHATKVLKEALDKIFAEGLDPRMMAAMPDFWRLYYEAVAAKSDYRPKDPSILRQNTVDQKALLLTKFEPESNEFAQANGVAGMALYHAVIGPDGKAQEIAVGRPIGFGLDENAVAAIRKASFQPAMKDGKPVPVLLDLVVQFRIFDKRTAAPAPPEPAGKPAEPVLPGPYSVQHP